MKTFILFFSLLSLITVGQEVHVFKNGKLLSRIDSKNKNLLSDTKEFKLMIVKLKRYLISILKPKKIGSQYYPLEDVIFRFDYYCIQIYKEKRKDRSVWCFSAFLPDEIINEKIIKTKRIHVSDGGSNYWQIEYNIKKKKFENLHINQPF